VDSLYWGSFRVSQVLAAVTCVAALVVLTVMAFRNHDPRNLFVNRVKAREAAEEAEEAETEEAEEPEEI